MIYEIHHFLDFRNIKEGGRFGLMVFFSIESIIALVTFDSSICSHVHGSWRERGQATGLFSRAALDADVSSFAIGSCMTHKLNHKVCNFGYFR